MLRVAVIKFGSLLSYFLRHVRKLHSEGVVHVAPVAFAAEQKCHAAITICFINRKAAFQFFWSSPKQSSSATHYCTVIFQFGKQLYFYIL